MNGTVSGYARALYRAAETRGVLARVSEELSLIAGILREHEKVLENPTLPASRKAATLRAALEGQADPLTVRFLTKLAADRHLKLLERIRQAYDAMAADALGDVTVRLYVRYAPSEKILRRLREELSAQGLIPLEKRDAAVFEIIIEESVIGGFIAEYRNSIIDASLKTKLARLNALKQG